MLSPEQSSKALATARSEEKQAKDDHDAALTAKTRADKTLASAQSAERVVDTQREAVQRERAALIALVASSDQTNEPAMHRMGAERYVLDTRLEALDGAAERAKAAREQAQADASAAHAAVRAAEENLQKARARLSDAQDDAWEARLIAAKESLPRHLQERAAYRERMEEREREREIRFCRDEAYRRYLANIGERCPSIEEKMRMEDELFNLVWAERHGEKPPKPAPSLVQTESRQPLKSGEQGWGQHLHSFDSRGPPVPVRAVRGGTEGTWDPFKDE